MPGQRMSKGWEIMIIFWPERPRVEGWVPLVCRTNLAGDQPGPSLLSGNSVHGKDYTNSPTVYATGNTM